MNASPDNERSPDLTSPLGEVEISPWVWRTRADAMRHIAERYPWLSFVIGQDALYKLAFDILMERRG